MKRFRALPVILSFLLLVAMLAGCGGGGTSENSSLVANAGSNHSVQVGHIVSLAELGRLLTVQLQNMSGTSMAMASTIGVVR